jgi:hypothetical protein
MSKECEACKSRHNNQRPTGGAFRLTCVNCCAALVASTNPNKQHASQMLACIERTPGAPKRKAVLAKVRQLLGKLDEGAASENRSEQG